MALSTHPLSTPPPPSFPPLHVYVRPASQPTFTTLSFCPSTHSFVVSDSFTLSNRHLSLPYPAGLPVNTLLFPLKGWAYAPGWATQNLPWDICSELLPPLPLGPLEATPELLVAVCDSPWEEPAEG